ncbi:ATP-binding protein [Methylomonas sp. SURF-2]|uniref:histidine kinase n=1 Tax=Methylomonas subterranea TaxID=2952225 RepID=A0ABT1TBQ1_9GAMM|nr:ATP-binding protein [Methylomonas sp. SURF-2]MCQ8102676.1 ATP-binding protein [Methylomonas sp. SURF-2]
MQFLNQLEVLRKKFAADLPARLLEIKTLYQTPDCDPLLLRQALHRLTGLAGTFKAHRISELARNMENRCARHLTDSEAENRQIIAILFGRLEAAVQEYLAETAPIDSTWLEPPVISQGDKVICLIAPPDSSTDKFAEALRENGYLLDPQPDLTAFIEFIDHGGALPGLIILDTALDISSQDQLGFQRFKAGIKDFPPLIFISERGDTLSRLAAVRAGASDYLLKTVSNDILLDIVAQYLHPPASRKILIVDDDNIAAGYIANIIDAAGYQSRILGEPLRIFEVLESFQPDLLILDIYMPDCSGIELAKAIRQCCCHNIMPILFLTTGTDIDQELCALGSGGDEFIRKTDPDRYLLEKLSYRLRRLDQIRALHKQLKSAQLRSERLRKSQSDFLTYVVHELKSPLNLILGYSELLQMDDKLSHEQRNLVMEIVKGGQSQLAMIEELSEQVKVSRGQFNLNLESFDVMPLLTQAVANAAILAAESGIGVQGRFDAKQSVYVRADRRRVEQILANLLSNAIKYNKPAGKVWISAQARAGKMLRIEVADTGLGIAPEDRELIFDAFERLNAAKQGIDGIGIGLSICSRLLTLMQGRIGVDSELDVGSKFWIELPLTAQSNLRDPL